MHSWPSYIAKHILTTKLQKTIYNAKKYGKSFLVWLKFCNFAFGFTTMVEIYFF